MEADLVDVQLDQASKRFGNVWALRPTDLLVRRGEFFSLLGSSGSGKTTTLRIIAGFEQPTSGRVFLRGQDVSRLPPYERTVNTVFQDYALFPHMSVEENIAYGLRVRRVKKSEIKTRVQESLRLVQLTDYGRRRPSQLSGGQRQRVALARALINVPAVLLLDEPLGALDLKLRREMQEELKRIQRDVGITFIYVTHDQEEAMSMSDRIAVMSDGQIVQTGNPTEVYEHPVNTFIAGFVGISNLFEGTVRTESGVASLDAAGCERLILPGGAEPVAGQTVLVAVRPEKMRMTLGRPQGAEPTNLLRGIVADVAYAGSFTRYTVRVGDQSVHVVEQNEGAGPRGRQGEEVWLSWRIDQTIVLPGTRHQLEQGQSAAIVGQ